MPPELVFEVCSRPQAVPCAQGASSDLTFADGKVIETTSGNPAPRRSLAVRHRPRRDGLVWLAQEAEERRCRLNKQINGDRSPQGGLSYLLTSSVGIVVVS